jgi:hypothetical protein
MRHSLQRQVSTVLRIHVGESIVSPSALALHAALAVESASGAFHFAICRSLSMTLVASAIALLRVRGEAPLAVAHGWLLL